eukprot:9172244-Pyramimonas_sp.AAC.1
MPAAPPTSASLRINLEDMEGESRKICDTFWRQQPSSSSTISWTRRNRRPNRQHRHRSCTPQA